jgi:tetratricopeptide (TPR) repeat protein
MEAVACYEAAGNTIAFLQHQAVVSTMLHDIGDFVAAERLCRSVYTAAHRADLKPAYVEVCVRLAYILYARGHYPEALTLIEQAQAAMNQPSLLVISHSDCYRGLVLAAQGHIDQATQLLRAALQEMRTGRWVFGIGLALNFLGQVLVQRGEYAEAHALLTEGLALCEASGNRIGIAFALTRLADATDDEIVAESHLQRALELTAQMEAAPLTCDGLVALANLRIRQNRCAEAQQLLQYPATSPACRAITRERVLRLLAVLGEAERRN